MDVEIASLWIYPLKSASGISLNQVQLSHKGFIWDRQWMLINEDNRFVSQRQLSEMARIKTKLTSDCLELSFPDCPSLSVPLQRAERASSPIPATMHRRDETILVEDEGTAAADWLSEKLTSSKSKLRLVRIARDFRRPIPDEGMGDILSESVDLADGYPFLVVGTASLDLLNDHLWESSAIEAPLGMERFRPNIILKTKTAWSEMKTGTMLVSEDHNIRFKLAKPCQRCGIPQVNQSTGARDVGAGLHQSLKQLSREETPSNDFGQNAILETGEGKSLTVGQTLRLLTPDDES